MDTRACYLSFGSYSPSLCFVIVSVNPSVHVLHTGLVGNQSWGGIKEPVAQNTRNKQTTKWALTYKRDLRGTTRLSQPQLAITIRKRAKPLLLSADCCFDFHQLLLLLWTTCFIL